MQHFLVKNLLELPGIASKLLEKYSDSRIFAFNGSMGSGKTTFIKALCLQLGVGDVVSSPTFAIINEYLTNIDESVFHFDCYRMEHPQEALEIGINDYLYSGNYCFIEWPERIANLLPDNCVYVDICLGKQDSERVISF